MMNHEKDAHEAIGGYLRFELDRYIAIEALKHSELLLPDPWTVTTVEELMELHPGTLLTNNKREALTAESLQRLDRNAQENAIKARLVVTADGRHLREVQDLAEGRSPREKNG